MAALSVDSRRAALLVVDMQRDFVHGRMAVHGAAALARRLEPLVRAARAAPIPVVFVSQAIRAGGEDLGPLTRFDEVRTGEAIREGGGGERIVDELGPAAEDLYVRKRRFSAFHQTDLDLLLRSSGVEQLLVCGVSAHVCCDTTVRDAFQLGYEPIYLADGVEMGDLPDLGFGPIGSEQAKAVIATTIAHRFGRVCSIDEAIGALER